MNNSSFWNDSIKKESFKDKKLEKDVDILIIGGGMTGINLAYFLKDYRGKVCLIDKGEFGCGITSKTTAKLSYLQEIIYQTLEKNFNKETALKYYNSQKESINIIKDIIKKNKISCDLEEVASIIFTFQNNNITKINKEKKLLEEFGTKTIDIYGNKIKKGIIAYENYVFNPLKYLYGLINIIKEKILLYEDVLATNITLFNKGYKVLTDKGIIRAKKVIVANHYPFFLLPTFIPFKTYIKREYVCVGKVNNHNNISAINIDKDLFSIRFYKNYLLYVSNKNRLTDNTSYSDSLLKSCDDFFKLFGVKPEYSYINQDVMSNDNLPFIGEVKNNLYIATAYNAWGMTNSVIASKVIYDLINSRTSTYKYLFDPNRNSFPLFLKSFVGSFHYVKAYAQSLWKKNTPSYVRIKNIWYGIYVDDENNKHIVKLICPHMKCNLVFNETEKTWDCPCHGSRFDIDGNIIEGPAVKSITKI